MDFGKYAVFVWSSYGVFALFIGGIIMATLRTAAVTRKRLEALTDEEGKPRPLAGFSISCRLRR